MRKKVHIVHPRMPRPKGRLAHHTGSKMAFPQPGPGGGMADPMLGAPMSGPPDAGAAAPMPMDGAGGGAPPVPGDQV